MSEKCRYKSKTPTWRENENPPSCFLLQKGRKRVPIIVYKLLKQPCVTYSQKLQWK